MVGGDGDGGWLGVVLTFLIDNRLHPTIRARLPRAAECFLRCPEYSNLSNRV